MMAVIRVMQRRTGNASICALLVLATLVVAAAPVRAEPTTATMYVNPQCSCCQRHANHLRGHGFKIIAVKETHDISVLRRQHGVPEKPKGCHIMRVEDYVVEGQVPAASIQKLLAERPKFKGISPPGTPDGSPSMTGRQTKPVTIYEISQGEPKIFGVE